MTTELASPPRTDSKAALWTGRVLSALAVLFLLMDGLMKVARASVVLEACGPLEIPEWTIPWIGTALTAATLIYAIPQTAVLGAILVTGYLGGATWTHLRMGGPTFPVVFPGLVAAFVWGGLYLREPRIRAILPWRRP